MINTLTVSQKIFFLDLIHVISFIVLVLYLTDYVYYPAFDTFCLFTIYIVTIVYKHYLRKTEEYDKVKIEHRSNGSKYKDS